MLSVEDVKPFDLIINEEGCLFLAGEHDSDADVVLVELTDNYKRNWIYAKDPLGNPKQYSTIQIVCNVRNLVDTVVSKLTNSSRKLP